MPASSRPIIRLVERRTSEVSLTRGDAACLMAAERCPIEVVPTLRKHRYLLTPRGLVGTLLTPHTRFVIRPKFSKVNLGLLLGLEDLTEHVDLLTQDIFNLLAARVSDLLERLLHQGLKRGYVERNEEQRFLQGRLDAAAQMREGGLKRDRFHCEIDKFTLDTPVHRLLKSTLEALILQPYLSIENRNRMMGFLACFAEVNSPSFHPGLFDLPAGSECSAEYRPILNLCRLLLEGQGTTWLLDIERAFEQYVTAGIEARVVKADGFALLSQPLYSLHDPIDGRTTLQLRPDLVLMEGQTPRCVCDTKWKRLRDLPEPDDVHQILAYATVLGVRDARLIYPGTRDVQTTIPLLRSEVCLTLHQIRITGSEERCKRSLRRLAWSMIRMRRNHD